MFDPHYAAWMMFLFGMCCGVCLVVAGSVIASAVSRTQPDKE